MAERKMGRPTDNPRPYNLGVRINAYSKTILEMYCKQESVNKTTAIERAIKKLEPDVKK